MECITSRPREDFAQWLSFFKGGYLRYASVAQVLRREWAHYGLLVREISPELYLDDTPMILGLRLRGRTPTHPLHSVYWTGKRVWDPYHAHFFELEELGTKVAYAFVREGGANRRVCSVDDINAFEGWDRCCEEHIRLPDKERAAKAVAAETSGSMWLEVRR